MVPKTREEKKADVKEARKIVAEASRHNPGAKRSWKKGVRIRFGKSGRRRKR